MKCGQPDVQEQNDVQFQFDPIYLYPNDKGITIKCITLVEVETECTSSSLASVKAEVVQKPSSLAPDSWSEIYLKTNSAKVYHI